MLPWSTKTDLDLPTLRFRTLIPFSGVHAYKFNIQNGGNYIIFRKLKLTDEFKLLQSLCFGGKKTGLDLPTLMFRAPIIYFLVFIHTKLIPK